MCPWESHPIWGFCTTPKNLVSFWGKGRGLFSVSRVPFRQGFRIQVLGPSTWIKAPKFRIWARGMTGLHCGLLDQLPRALVGKGFQAEGHNAFLCPGAPPVWAWSHGPCSGLPFCGLDNHLNIQYSCHGEGGVPFCVSGSPMGRTLSYVLRIDT